MPSTGRRGHPRRSGGDRQGPAGLRAAGPAPSGRERETEGHRTPGHTDTRTFPVPRGASGITTAGARMTRSMSGWAATAPVCHHQRHREGDESLLSPRNRAAPTARGHGGCSRKDAHKDCRSEGSRGQSAGGENHGRMRDEGTQVGWTGTASGCGTAMAAWGPMGTWGRAPGAALLLLSPGDPKSPPKCASARGFLQCQHGRDLQEPEAGKDLPETCSGHHHPSDSAYLLPAAWTQNRVY